MGATYTRQASYTDGDVIQASDTNNEFDQLLAAFASSSGHTHDGTTAEGGPITKMLGTSLTLGDGTAGTDITITYDGESNDGVMKWMEDEDYFEFSDDILIATTEKLQFRDTAIYINSSADGQLDLVADTEIQIAATTIDINGNADISGNLGIGGNLTVTGTTTFNGGTITMGDAATDNVVFGADVDSNIIPDDDDTYDLGSASQQWRNLFIDGTANIDALVADTADINGGSIDGVTLGTNSAITQAVIDSVNINGATIGHTDDTDLITLADGIVTVAGELDAVSLDISGDVDIGGTLETDALSIASTAVSATAAELNYNDTGASVGTVVASKTVTVDANKDVASFRNITLTGELDAGSLDISGDADIDGTLEADAITIGGVTLAETISDTVGAMVSGNTETNIAVSYDDADNTLDFVIGTLNQDTTGNAATATILETARTIGGTSFNGSANIAVALSATATALATARTIHGVSFDGTANIDLSEVVSDTVGAMFSSNTETGITATYQDADNTIDLVIGAGAVVNSMLADDAVGADELAANAVVTASIVDANVTTAKITDLNVTTAKIAADAITEAKIADNAVESEHLNDNVISGQTALTSGLATTDELLVSDAGTLKKMDVSVLTALTDDNATALAIALG